ncbi:hypothetical protein DFH07DRAFT_946953 [Mycena maculata]|uniref:Uncharacterized protein n=1 Tax=Mycena maculata TaxID=230809 RepID=A0AAD7HHL6_9AGAR|nr:hypothetical protein DFH07DRAFT_946953 [Mycena maculata]
MNSSVVIFGGWVAAVDYPIPETMKLRKCCALKSDPRGEVKMEMKTEPDTYAFQLLLSMPTRAWRQMRSTQAGPWLRSASFAQPLSPPGELPLRSVATKGYKSYRSSIATEAVPSQLLVLSITIITAYPVCPCVPHSSGMELIEVGQSIEKSVEKVRENRRRMWELVNDVFRSLADIANLTRGKEDEFQAPALLGALGELEGCPEVIPVERTHGLRGFGFKFKVWINCDDIEAEIQRLKEHLTTGKDWVFEVSHWDPRQSLSLVFATTTSPTHVLHRILGAVLKSCDSPTGIQIASLAGILCELGVDLHSLGMASEAIAWEVSSVQVFRHLAGQECLSESILNAEADIQPLLMTVLINHSINLHNSRQHETAITFSQEAVLLCRPMVRTMIKPAHLSERSGYTNPDELQVVMFRARFGALDPPS